MHAHRSRRRVGEGEGAARRDAIGGSPNRYPRHRGRGNAVGSAPSILGRAVAGARRNQVAEVTGAVVFEALRDRRRFPQHRSSFVARNRPTTPRFIIPVTDAMAAWDGDALAARSARAQGDMRHRVLRGRRRKASRGGVESCARSCGAACSDGDDLVWREGLPAAPGRNKCSRVLAGRAGTATESVPARDVGRRPRSSTRRPPTGRARSVGGVPRRRGRDETKRSSSTSGASSTMTNANRAPPDARLLARLALGLGRGSGAT